MDLFFLILVSFGASCLTFFCGFGLGTILTPVFYIITKDLVLALMMTAVIHFLNNLFKFFLMQKKVDWSVAGKFGIAAIPAAFLGAYLVTYIENIQIGTISILGFTNELLLLNSIFGVVLILFALIELIDSWGLYFAKKSLILGGLLSGFFGGLSGHQGALRTAFLIKFNLSKETFIATGIVIALAVDLVRTPIYFRDKYSPDFWNHSHIMIFSLGAAFAGAIMGRLILKKMKLKTLTKSVSIAMIIFGILLSLGFLNK